jgi:hypothetical protein
MVLEPESGGVNCERQIDDMLPRITKLHEIRLAMLLPQLDDQYRGQGLSAARAVADDLVDRRAPDVVRPGTQKQSWLLTDRPGDVFAPFPAPVPSPRGAPLVGMVVHVL